MTSSGAWCITFSSVEFASTCKRNLSLCQQCLLFLAGQIKTTAFEKKVIRTKQGKGMQDKTINCVLPLAKIDYKHNTLQKLRKQTKKKWVYDVCKPWREWSQWQVFTMAGVVVGLLLQQWLCSHCSAIDDILLLHYSQGNVLYWASKNLISRLVLGGL